MRAIVFALFGAFLFQSCDIKKSEEVKVSADEGTYFSVRQLIMDQWNTYRGQPYGLQKIVSLNGKTDSTLTNSYDMEWGPLFKLFFDTDISDPKYLEQYDFTMFEDNTTETRNFYYEAKNSQLYTRKLQISADAFTNKIRSVYIEAVENSRWHDKTRKLFYIPLKVISVQEFEHTTPGPDKELRIEYRFL